jgi:hypothetical protein
MASGKGLRSQAEHLGVRFHSQPGLWSEPPAKDALYRETLQTTGRTTRILNRPKRGLRQSPSRSPRDPGRGSCECAPHVEPSPRYAFSEGMAESINPMGEDLKTLVRDTASRIAAKSFEVIPSAAGITLGLCSAAIGPGPGQKARRRNVPCLIVLMSSGRLFLDRVARQQSPSPLHRHPQNNMHSSDAPGRKGTFLLCREGDISILP